MLTKVDIYSAGLGAGNHSSGDCCAVVAHRYAAASHRQSVIKCYGLSHQGSRHKFALFVRTTYLRKPQVGAAGQGVGAQFRAVRRAHLSRILDVSKC